jgi:hypothetical protein
LSKKSVNLKKIGLAPWGEYHKFNSAQNTFAGEAPHTYQVPCRHRIIFVEIDSKARGIGPFELSIHKVINLLQNTIVP